MQVDATRLRQDLTPLIPTYAELTANASSNSLILTDTEANIRRVVEIVRALDSALSSVTEVKVFPLKYADATKTATLIETLFKPTDQAQGTGRVVGTFFGAGARRPGQAAQTPDQSQSQRTSAKVTASADTRTNTLVVSAPPETLKVIEEVVEKLDASTEATQAVFVYPLKNGDAANLQVTLNNLFGTSTATGTAARTTASRTTTGRTTTAGRTTATGTTARATSTRANISLSPGDTESLYGQVYIVADIDTNSLMVMTASKNFDRVKEIIAELDRAVPQVLIKVLIAEITLDKSFDLGTEFSILDFGADTYGQKIDTKFGLVDMQGGITVNLLRKNLSATLSALQNVGKVNVLSRPYILGSNNQTASITVGQNVPSITASRETDLGSTVNTITYEDIGIILEVTPQINPDGLVTLTVKPEISSLTSSTVAISEKVKAPVYSKRSATSRVAIPDGQTIVIGGLMQDEKLDEVKKVPLLGSIPILNLLFSRKTTSNTKTELLIFLTPHVSSNPDSLAELSEGTLEGSTIKTSGAPELFDQHLEEMGKRGPKEGNTIKQSSDPEPFDIQLDEMEKSAPEEKSIKKSDAPEPLNLRLDEKEDL
jgi:general secretion pathway protein D